MERWVVTGISGSGRIELLQELSAHVKTLGRSIIVHDIGDLIRQECIRNGILYTDKRILDLDNTLLTTLRSSALKEAIIQAQIDGGADFHFIGTHATFRWKNRLIPGISFSDLNQFNPDGFVSIVDNVKKVLATNKKNPKWDKDEVPNYEETQDWMTEEEFVTEVLSDVFRKPIYLVAREHKIENLADLFLSKKKKIYLSYPITAVEKDNPDLLDRVQGPILKELEKLFVVFNPLTIRDMQLAKSNLPDKLEELTPKAKNIIKTRTVARDFQFIDQADAVVVFYLTDKVSPGVLAEIFYAHRNQKPVYMVYPFAKSPFIEDVTSLIETDIEPLMKYLSEFAKSK